MYINFIDKSSKNNICNDEYGWVDAVTSTKYFITKSEYEKNLDLIKSNIRMKNADEIYEYLKNDVNEIPYLIPFIKNNPRKVPSLKDAATLSVCFAYCLSNNKDIRRETYLHFFDIKRSQNEKVIKAVELLNSLVNNDKSNLNDNILKKTIKIVKGGVYKTKKYIMENNDIKCLRGSSYLLDNINRHRIPQYFEKNYIKESIIYCGGGNVLAIIPDDTNNISNILEEIYNEVTLVAQNAFITYKTTLRDILFDYTNTIKKIEEELEDRKKLKLYINIDPAQGDINNGLYDKEYRIELSDSVKKLPDNGKDICKKCNIRDAHYSFYTSGEDTHLCLSCLHKVKAGIFAKDDYHDQFQKIYSCNGKGKYGGKKVEGLDEIGSFSDKNYMAVIYGDGNNFGNLIKNIKSIYEMMYFSRKTELAAYKATLAAINETYKNENKEIPLEIIALGGEDIFLIVPAKGSLSLASKLIEVFDEEFKDISSNVYNATMSIGVVISKYTTPIRNMFEIALTLLKKAKKYSKQINGMKGTLSFIVLESNSYIDLSDKIKLNKGYYDVIRQGIGRYTWDEIVSLIGLIKNMKDDNSAKSHIYKIRDAASRMIPLEFKLFYMYDKSRNKDLFRIENKLKDIIKINAEFQDGLFKIRGEYYSPWYDITEIIDYV